MNSWQSTRKASHKDSVATVSGYIKRELESGTHGKISMSPKEIVKVEWHDVPQLLELNSPQENIRIQPCSNLSGIIRLEVIKTSQGTASRTGRFLDIIVYIRSSAKERWRQNFVWTEKMKKEVFRQCGFAVSSVTDFNQMAKDVIEQTKPYLMSCMIIGAAKDSIKPQKIRETFYRCLRTGTVAESPPYIDYIFLGGMDNQKLKELVLSATEVLRQRYQNETSIPRIQPVDTA
jgi:hypothetical protein